MQLENKTIEEFRKIYRDDYNIQLEFEEAKKLALNFIIQMSAIHRQIPKINFKNSKNQLY